jgi:tetratricopeptide (TPR) repeat protein
MALGLLAKPMLVTLPFVLLLLDYWPLHRFDKGRPAALIREKAPFFLLTAISILVTLSAQGGGGAMRSSESVGLGLRIGNAMVSYVRYLGKAIWPSDLAILYPHPNIPAGGGIPWLAWEIAASAVVLGLLTGLVCFWGRHYRYLAVGWLGFLGTLIPVIGIVQVGTQAMADRYTYVPLIWIFLAVSWGAGEVVTVLRRRLPAIRFVATGLALIWLITLATLARQQTGYWRDSVTLFQHALSVSPDSSVLHLAYSTALAQQGRHQESIAHSKRAIQIRPDYPEAHSDLGSLLSDLGRHKPALKHHEKAIALSPGAAEAYYNYANALARSGDLGGARRAYQQAIRRNPSFAPAHHNLARLKRDAGETEDAIVHYRAALDANPYLSGTHYQLALTLAQQGRNQEAARHFQAALEQDPENQLAREQWEALKRPQAAPTRPTAEPR